MAEQGGEKLQATIDLGTAQAFANVQSLIAAIDRLGERLQNATVIANSTTQTLDQVGQGAERVGNSTNAAKDKVQQFDEATTKADWTFRRAAQTMQTDGVTGWGAVVSNAQKATSAVQTFDNATTVSQKTLAQASLDMSQSASTAWGNVTRNAEAAAKKIEDVRQRTDETSLSTDALTGRVIALASAYFGINAAIQLMRQLRQSIDETADAQIRLANARLQFQELLTRVQINLGVSEPQAQKLVLDFAERTRLTKEQSAALIASGVATGYQVTEPTGRGVLEQVGRYAAFAALQPEPIEQLLKLMQQQNVQTPEAAQQIIAQLHAAFTKTGTSDINQFLSYLLKAAIPQTLRGVPLGQAVGQFSAAVSAEPQPSEAATNVDILTRIAEGTTAQQREMIAKQMAQLGRIQPRQVGADELEGYIADESTKEAKAVGETRREIRRHLEETNIQRRNFDTALANRMDELKRARARHPQNVANLERDVKRIQENYDTEARRREETLQRLNEQEARQLDTLRSAEEGRAAVQTYEQVPINERMQMLLGVIGQGIQIPAVAELFQGLPARQRGAILRQAGPQAQAVGVQAQAAFEAATPQQFRAAWEQFLTRGVAGARLNEIQIERRNVQAGGIGDEQMRQMTEAAKAEVERRTAAGKFISAGGVIKSTAMKNAEAFADLLSERIKERIRQLSPAERAVFEPRFTQIISEIEAGGLPGEGNMRAEYTPVDDWVFNVSKWQLYLNSLAARFGEIDNGIQNDRARALDQATTQPTTRQSQSTSVAPSTRPFMAMGGALDMHPATQPTMPSEMPSGGGVFPTMPTTQPAGIPRHGELPPVQHTLDDKVGAFFGVISQETADKEIMRLQRQAALLRAATRRAATQPTTQPATQPAGPSTQPFAAFGDPLGLHPQLPPAQTANAEPLDMGGDMRPSRQYEIIGVDKTVRSAPVEQMDLGAPIRQAVVHNISIANFFSGGGANDELDFPGRNE